MDTPTTAVELLADESKWTTGAFARNADGVTRNARHDDSVCWCIQGAVNKIYDPDNLGEKKNKNLAEVTKRILRFIKENYDPPNFVKPGTHETITEWNVTLWNDWPDRTYDEVIHVLGSCAA